MRVAATNADNDENRHIIATMIQVITAKIPGHRFKPSTTPKAVATPLPPLKRRNTGHIWPRKTNSATTAITLLSNPQTGAKCCANTTATQPLPESPSNVNIAAALLPLRKTLVAPGFIEPKVRGSGNLKIQLATTANETDPSK